MRSNDFANALRKNLTDAEKKLWRELRNRNFCKFKFRRQHPVGKYILDFVCIEKSLVIELDGGQHNFEENQKCDKIRDEFLNKKGFKILRFWNSDLVKNFDGVLQEIYSEINKK